MSFRIVRDARCRCSAQVSAFLYHALQYEFPSLDAAVLFLMEFVPANERHLAQIAEPDGQFHGIDAIAGRYAAVTGRHAGHIGSRCAACPVQTDASRTPPAPEAGSARPAASAW